MDSVIRKRPKKAQASKAMSKVCSDILEDILKKTFEEEEPFVDLAPMKSSQATQTASSKLKIKHLTGAFGKFLFKIATMTSGKMQDKATSLFQSNYMSKEFLAKACSDFIEDILRKTFDEEDPISQAPVKCSQETQTCAKDFPLQTKKKKFLF